MFRQFRSYSPHEEPLICWRPYQTRSTFYVHIPLDCSDTLCWQLTALPIFSVERWFECYNFLVTKNEDNPTSPFWDRNHFVYCSKRMSGSQMQLTVLEDGYKINSEVEWCKSTKEKVLPGIEPGSPGCPTSIDMMSIRTGSDNRYTIEPDSKLLLDGENSSSNDYECKKL